VHGRGPKWRNWQTRYVQGVVGESPWEFESPLRHHPLHVRHRPRPRAWGTVRTEGTRLVDAPGSRDLDLAVLSHLRGYPEELRRFSNLMKQAHPQGRSAAEFFLTRPVAAGSFIAALIGLLQAGEDIVTVVEAAELLGDSPAALLTPPRLSQLPAPLAGEGRYRIWRRAAIVGRMGPRQGPGTGA
jgi:hypothetical protein